MRRLMITVSISADPRRADGANAIDRLIWGRHAGSQAGLAEMMSLAKLEGIRLVMLLDWCSEQISGTGVADVALEIQREGHDLQVQARDELLTPEFWEIVRARHPEDARLTRAAVTEAVVELVTKRHRELTGSTPRVYRTGSSRYDPALLRSLTNHGIPADACCNPARSDDPLHGRSPLKPFRWDTGGLELTVACVDGYRNLDRVVDLNFDSAPLHSEERLLMALERFYEQQNDAALAVMTMNSWSFLPRRSDGTLGAPSVDLVERFGAFLRLLGEHDVHIVGTEEAISLHADGGLGIDVTLPIAALATGSDAAVAGKQERTASPETLVAATAPAVLASSALDTATPATYSGRRCPVCGLGAQPVEGLDGASKARRCSSYGSLERQRGFALIYESFLCEEFDLRGKHAMAISPSAAERQLFARYGLADVISVDIRPAAKPDVVADICCMPEIARHSYDCVIASYVLTWVYDLDAALMEIHRVLKPSGYFLFSEPLVFGSPTSDYEEHQAITSWYGEDAYARYRVGHFRSLGDLDILERLVRGFVTKTFYARDPITNDKIVWHAARRREHASANRL